MTLSQEYRSHWSLIKKSVFRFLFLYFIIYVLLLFSASLFEIPFKWIGKHILGINYTYNVSGSGSGDHTYAYLSLFINIALAISLLPIWSYFDRKRASYNKFFYVFILLLRIFVFGAMLLYGFVKLFKIQFTDTSLVRLMQPLGEFSPMGLAWAYMSYSKGFGVFAGFMEILGGVLLISKRTQTLGAFIVIGVMTQVAMMNMFFDIPVKLFSIHLVLMGLTIFFTDIKRFVNVFIKNKATKAANHYHPITDETAQKGVFWIKLVGLTIIIIAASIFLFQTERKLKPNKKMPLYGIWETKVFIKNNDTLLPLLTDDYQWRYLVIEKKDRVLIKTMNEKRKSYFFAIDSINKSITFGGDQDKDSSILKYKTPNPISLEISGKIENDSVFISLKKKDEFLLKSRGFNWINEYPFNR